MTSPRDDSRGSRVGPRRGSRLAAITAVAAAAAAVAAAVALALEDGSGGQAAAPTDTPPGAALPGAAGAIAPPRRPSGAAAAAPALAPRRPVFPRIRYRPSRALGEPHAGSLVRGTRLPARATHFDTWDPILRRSPSRPWRRYGTDALVRLVVRVGRRYAAAERAALPMLVGDLSRPRGGDFGPQYGFIGHSTHQNGLDVDVYYPRSDRRPIAPRVAGDVDRPAAQRLVDLFVEAGAETVLVGPNVGLVGPPDVVKPYPNHDNHLHVRIANPR